MAQSGIPVPATRCRLPLFRQLRADIGDHQSIEADLSTFSAHVTAITGFLRDPAPPALFLFDEIGTGTEPAEGAALARAVLEKLVRSEVKTIATTHLGALKAWAVETAGVACAAMELDDRTFRPTYRVLPGVAGTSAGLHMAARLGLDEELVRRARELLGEESAVGEGYLARLRELITEAENRRDRLARRESELEERRREFDHSTRRERERRQREAGAALERAVDQLRRGVRKEVETIEEEAERRRAARRLERRLRAESARARGVVSETHPGKPVGELREGLAVRVRSLGREGIVGGWKGEKVAVRIGNVSVSVDRSDLDAASAPPPPRESRPERRAHPEPVVDDSSCELHLVGQRVEEGVAMLDRFLDRALLSDHAEVRIVHGHGTGRLRRAVRDFLARHPRVESVRPGRDGEGGDGATVARLG